MKAFAAFAALFCTANAVKTRWTPCCFHPNASGAVTGTVGPLDDGQNRVNGALAPTQFCIADGAITDANGRGCIITRKYNTHPTSIVAHIYKHKLPNSNVTADCAWHRLQHWLRWDCCLQWGNNLLGVSDWR